MKKKVLIPTKLDKVAKSLLEASGKYTVIQQETKDLPGLAGLELDMKVLVFPLDADCNWLLGGRSMHPGACVLAKAVLCAEGRGNCTGEAHAQDDGQDDEDAE